MFTLTKRTALAVAIASAVGGYSQAAFAAEEAADKKSDDTEYILVRGLRNSLKAAMFDKKEGVGVYDGIAADDLGKFPDQNVAESLQRITGVSIDRSGGEGQFVTVRGFGPQFNTVLVNGRQIATENPGREFSFDTLAAELITGVDVYKSPTANMQEGGIGATINVNTAKPLNYDGFKAVASAKGVYDDLSEETTPQFSGLISNTFMEGKAGVLVSLAHQERTAQDNIMESRYYRPNVSFETQNGKQFTNAYVPQNFDVMVDEQDRTRTSGTAVFQYAPSDELTLTFDGLISQFEVESDVHSLGHWFSESNFIDAEVDENNSVVYIENANTGATDFIRRNYNREVDVQAFGFNAEWQINDDVMATFDVSTSTAEEKSAGDVFFNVIGYNNAYTWDNRDGSPSIEILGGEDAALRADLGRAHYNERNGWDREDTITEFKTDFEWETGLDTFTSMRWGGYYQDREKDAVRKYASDCNLYCGYGTDVPDELLTEYTANGFFGGVPDRWLTYDVAAYDAYRESVTGDTGYSDPQGQADQYTVEEEILSAYIDFTFEGDLGDLPWQANVGVRYTQTDTTLSGVTQELIDLQEVPNDPSDLFEVYAPGGVQPVSASNSYTNLLPSVNVKFDLTDEMVMRVAYSETLTRPTMDELNPATTVTVSRPNNNAAQGGNADLKPFVSSNWDVSYEWYYADTSYFAAAIFSKEVDDFITSTVATEVWNLESGAYNFNVRRPRNGETAEVNGLELAWTHTWENGFGLQANATFVDSDAELDNNSTESFGLEGLGDSQNIVGFYENGPYQLRLAFNNREGFLQDQVNRFGGTEPLKTDTYGQWDISGSYEINEMFTVFFEGINITGEETRRHSRYQNQFVRLEDNGTRWAFGVRANF
ncbi:TonB-dependent receptor [Thalassotalea sp. M1531]|uniref:TonB-dependent receptor n=1 Tax=Thalassotalea algicola TaxID=2716224 RepID=A0A7Y0Q6P3_9GAMM|nr:TonB-dependent receptor [Thalassotalea algicola]NMP30185.1 TonB-dependent receptor [Thalassotalea algicola]